MLVFLQGKREQNLKGHLEQDSPTVPIPKGSLHGKGSCLLGLA